MDSNRKPPTAELRFRDNLIQTSRRLLFEQGDSEAETIEKMEWLVAGHIACRDHIEWSELSALVEDLAVDVKPLALEIVLRARKAGRL